ncbi:HDOD domain-containing protein, partial [bacterium]|nr:HDOD domain-containing protein [bacterium]
TLSDVAQRLIDVTADERHSLTDVVKVVQTDASLTAHVLRIANSAAFARRQEINSLDQAVMRLGERLVMGIAVGACSAQLYDASLAGYEAGSGALWDHSLRCAISAREVSKYANEKISSDLAFTAGLMIDIGKGVISEFLRGRTKKMTKLYDEGVVDTYLEAERKIIDTDHVEVGAEVARQWKLPDRLASAIEFHHHPDRAPEEHRTLTFAVHLGDWIASMSGGAGIGSDSLSYELNDAYHEYYTLTTQDFDMIILNVQEEFQQVKDQVMARDLR